MNQITEYGVLASGECCRRADVLVRRRVLSDWWERKQDGIFK